MVIGVINDASVKSVVTNVSNDLIAKSCCLLL